MNFIFQVNGKIIQHHANIEMLNSDESITQQVSLKNWEEWYKILWLFESMWYPFAENRNMNQWISDLLNEDDNKIYIGKSIKWESLSFISTDVNNWVNFQTSTASNSRLAHLN